MFEISRKMLLHMSYLCLGPSELHPRPLGWEMRYASMYGMAESVNSNVQPGWSGSAELRIRIRAGGRDQVRGSVCWPEEGKTYNKFKNPLSTVYFMSFNAMWASLQLQRNLLLLHPLFVRFLLLGKPFAILLMTNKKCWHTFSTEN